MTPTSISSINQRELNKRSLREHSEEEPSTKRLRAHGKEEEVTTLAKNAMFTEPVLSTDKTLVNSEPSFNHFPSLLPSSSPLLERINQGDETLCHDKVSWEELEEIDLSTLTDKGQKIYCNSLVFKKLKAETKPAENLKSDVEVTCRYTNIYCPQATAIPVNSEPPYLHANHVEFFLKDLPEKVQDHIKNDKVSSYILAQAPIQSTQESFWKAALQHSALIVDLTQPNDGVPPYFPKTALEEKKIKSILVACSKTETLEYGITLNHYHVTDAMKNEKEMIRIHFSNWEDHKGVDLVAIEYLVSQVEHLMQRDSRDLPPIIHCLAGVGRSGTFAVLATLFKLSNEDALEKKQSLEIIKTLILKGREQRGEFFVQKASQLQTLFKFAKKMMESKAISPRTTLEIEKSAENEKE